MIANFLNDPILYQNYEVTFSYRKSKQYDLGLAKRVNKNAPRESYSIFSASLLTDFFLNQPKVFQKVIRFFNYILLMRWWIFIWNTYVLYRAWKNRSIDILHINNGGYPGAISCLSASVAGRLAGIRHVVMVVNNIATASPWYWWQDLIINLLVKRSVTTFVTGSMNAKSFLQSLLKLPNEKLATLHNGIANRDTTEFISQTKVRLGIPENVLVFGVVALLEKRKGHHVLIEAISKLKTKVLPKDMPLFLIEGEGSERISLERLTESLEVWHWVRFVGQENNIFNFMQSLDILLLTSIANEDFPNVILEGMSLGKPVIASRIAGTPEQVDNGVTGWLVEPNDATELANKIVTFIHDRKSVEYMGAQGRLRFQSEFTSTVAILRYLKLYKKLLS